MGVATHVRPPHWLRGVAPAAAMAAIAGGILVLAAGAFNLGILDRLVSGSAGVKLGTSVGFILLGTALWLLRSEFSPTRHQQIATACAAAVVIIGVLMAGRYVLAYELWQWPHEGRLEAFLPDLVPPVLIVSFFGLSAALLMLGTERTVWLSQGLALSTAVFVLVRYLYNFSRVTGLHPHIGSSALLLILILACGIFAARPHRDLMQLITSKTPGGVLVRRLLPVAIAVPIMFGWLRMQGELLGFYGIHFGVGIGVMCSTVALSAAVLWVGFLLSRSDVERRRFEEALSREKAYFRALSDNTHDMVVILSADGIIRYASPSHLYVVGYRPEELIGVYPFDLMHPDDAPEPLRVFQEGLHIPGNTRRVEYRFRHRDGRWRVIEAIATNLLSHPVLAGVVVTSRDVTASKDAAHRLQTYARQQAALAELSRRALMNRDLSELMHEAVRTATETLKVDCCEVLEVLPDGSSLRVQAAAGWNQGALAGPVVEAGAASHAGYTLLSHEPVVFEDVRTETRFTASELQAQGVTSGVSVAIGDRQKPFGTVGAYTRDRRTFATDEIRFLQSLADVLAQTIQRRRVENRLRLMLEQMPAVLWTTDTDLRFTGAAGGALASFGKQTDEIAGLTLQQSLGTDDPQDTAIAAHRRALAGASVDYDHDWMGRRFHCHVEPLRDDTGTAIGVIGVLQDITERARTEEHLRTSEALFRAVVENGAEAISLWHADGTSIYLSPNHSRVFGYPPGTKLSGTWMDYVDPRDLPQCVALFGGVLQHLGQPVTHETRVRREDGSWIWAEVTACNLLDDPRVRAIVVNAHDISERKRAEEDLRKSEERFALAMAGANDGLWDWNFETDEQYLSPRCKEILGFQEGELPEDITALRSRIHPEDRERMRASFSAHLRGSTPFFRSEFRLQHKDGAYRWVIAHGRVLHSPEGKPLRIAGSLVDIAARRRAEEALRESEQRFRSIADTAPVFIWMTGPDGPDCTYVNQRWLDFRGRTLEQEIGDGWRDAVHPDDLISLEVATAAARKGREYSVELRARGADGQYHWLLCTGRPRYTADGTFLGLVGSSVDITERKRVEAALHESEERYRLLVELSPDPIWVHCEGKMVFVNPAGLTLFGATNLEQVIGRPSFDFLHPDFHESVRRRWQRLQEGLSVPFATIKLLRLDGTPFEVESGITSFIYQGKPAIFVVGRDLTERRRSEAALHDYAERLEMLSRRLLEVQEIERRALARELHDEIGQSLTAVKITLQRKRPQPESATLGRYLEDSIAVVDQAIRQVRNLSLDLRPSLLDDLGLVPALRWYVDRQAQRSGLNVQLIAEPLETRPPPEVETACFRVVQDALTNAMHHARAQRVRIELRRQEAQLHVVVHDDGIGFDVAQQRARAARGGSMGLLSMEERAALLGGRLEITSAHARGTKVHACFPLKSVAL